MSTLAVSMLALSAGRMSELWTQAQTEAAGTSTPPPPARLPSLRARQTVSASPSFLQKVGVCYPTEGWPSRHIDLADR